MPQREYSRIAGRKHESGDYFPFLNAFSSRAGDDLSELVCLNGHVSVQGQPSRVSRASFLNTLPCGVQNESIVGQKVGILHDILPAVPSSELDSCLNNELAPWLDYPFDVGMEQDYAPQRLAEVSVVGLSGQNSCELDLSNLDSGEKGPSFSYKPYFPWPSQNPQVTGVIDNITNQVEFVLENQAQGRDMFTDARQRRSNSKMVNFPHFSKQSVTNLQNPVGIPVSSGSKNKNTDTDFQVLSAPEMVSNAMQELTKQVLNEDLPKEIDIENEKLQVQSSEHVEKQVTGNELPVETNVACSSVGSVHGAEVVSSDQTNQCKRKSCEADDSGGHSEDDIVNVAEKKHVPRRGSVSKRSEAVEVGRDHADGKKPAPPCKGTTRSKRSRVAEVHNLSERRRRDRINEKMKALQELIPNCNKADKASMLGEAIEYLKMLQFQVQFMSMGGVYMPVMFPQGIQPMYPHLSPFPPMGVGINAGFGVGMVDSRSPIFPTNVPQVPHFTSPVSGSSNMFRVTGPGLPVYGPHTSEQRPQPVPINPQHIAIPASTCHNKQPCPTTVLNPMNTNSKTSSQLTSIATVSEQSHQAEAMNQRTQGAIAAHSHVTK